MTSTNKAVIFDMDGLIIDSEPLWRKSEMEVFKSIGYHFTEDMCIQTMGMRIDEVVQYWHNIFEWREPSIDEVVDKIQKKLIENVKLHGKALDGVDYSIKMLKDNGYQIALASSSSLKIIDVVLNKLSLHNSFDVVHSAQDEEFGKPHPAVFLTTANRLNIVPENCIVLEDSKAGMLAGLNANMKVIVIPEKLTKPDWISSAHTTLNSLNDLNLNHLS